MATPLISESPPSRRFLPAIAVVTILLISSFNCWLVTAVPLDDAFVYFRYARNHVNGFGPVFNVDEAVEGYSSVLWMMILNVVAMLGLSLPISAQVLSISCYLCTSLLIVYTSWRQQPLRWMAPLHFVASLAPAMWAGMALETSFFALLVLTAVLACLWLDRTREERRCTGVVLMMLALARPEGIVLSCALLGFRFAIAPAGDFRGKLGYMTEYLWPFLVWIFFLVGRYHFYGYLQPNTYYAKVGSNFMTLARGSRYLIDFLNSNTGTAWLLPLMAIHGVLFRRDRQWWILMISISTLCITTVMSGGNNWPFWRYAIPMFPLLTLLVAEFFRDGWRMAGHTRSFCPSGWRRLAVGVVYLFVVVRTFCAGLATDQLVNFVARNRDFQSYAEFHGRVYDVMLTGTQSIALNPMPFVSAHFDGPIVDMLGLVDEHIAHRPMTMGRLVHSHEKGDGAYVLERRPTILLFKGNLDFSLTLPRYPNPKDLYFVSDIEIAGSASFRELYEPLTVWVPAAGGYINAFKLKKESVASVAPAELDAIYMNTIGRVRSMVPPNLQILSALQRMIGLGLEGSYMRFWRRIIEVISPSVEIS